MVLLKITGKKDILINCDNILYIEARPTYASLNSRADGNRAKCKAIIHFKNSETLDLDDANLKDVFNIVERLASDCGEVEIRED